MSEMMMERVALAITTRRIGQYHVAPLWQAMIDEALKP